MRHLMILFFMSMFLSTQLMAALCSSECSLNVISPVKSNTSKNSSENHGCHQSSEEQESSSSKKNNGCEYKVCELDEIIDAKNILFNFDVNHLDFADSKPVFSPKVNLVRHTQLSIPSKEPPRYGLFLNVPLFVQKSSYLI